MGPGAHVLTFPVDHGRICNMVAFVTSKDDWSDYHKLTRSAHRSDAQRDFKGFSSDVHKLLALAKDDLDVVRPSRHLAFRLTLSDRDIPQWAIFHLGDNPLPHYNKSSVVLVGDAAHATSPHHGAGAGMCVEDSAVLAELLALPEVRDARSIEKAFAVYNEVRRERDNFVVQSSAHQGEAYEFLAPGIGKDFDRIKKEMMTRNARITDVDIRKICDDARDALRAKLGDA
jgi:salicylate hydroxylase